MIYIGNTGEEELGGRLETKINLIQNSKMKCKKKFRSSYYCIPIAIKIFVPIKRGQFENVFAKKRDDYKQ